MVTMPNFRERSTNRLVASLFLSVVVTALLFAFSCSKAGRSSSELPLTPAQARSLAQDLTPGFRDLPSGFQAVGEGKLVANEEAARGSIVEVELLKAYDNFGRLIGYVATYQQGSTTLTTAADVYGSAAGAKQASNWVPQSYKTVEDYLAAEISHRMAKEFKITNSDAIKASFVQLSVAQIGDSSIAGRISLAVGGRTLPLPIVTACMLKKNISVCIIGINLQATPSSQQEIDLLKTMEGILQKVETRITPAK